MRGRPVALSVGLILGTIAVGLTLRLARLGLPYPVVKYGGSMLWALMIYWMVSFLRPRWSVLRCSLASGTLAFGVELFKLYQEPLLDAFRLTLPGALLLGRVFSAYDLVAYVVAIVLGAQADRATRKG